MDFIKPKAKIGDIIIVTIDKDTYSQYLVVGASYRREFEDKKKKWSYWVAMEKYDDDFNLIKYRQHVSENKIKANLTENKYFHKVKKLYE